MTTTTTIETLVSIAGPRFVAGIVAHNGRVAEVAPILKKHITKGMTGEEVAAKCRDKGWTWTIVAQTKIR